MTPTRTDDDDHTLLARIDERNIAICQNVDRLRRQFDNHLAHHWAVSIGVLLAAAAAVFSAVIAFVSR